MKILKEMTTIDKPPLVRGGTGERTQNTKKTCFHLHRQKKVKKNAPFSEKKVFLRDSNPDVRQKNIRKSVKKSEK